MPRKQTEQPTVLVCGLGRCGMTMVMQMLAAAGLDMYGEPPAYESGIVPPMRLDLAHLEGKAAKMLNPHLLRGWPHKLDPIVIWLRRYRYSQAQSQIKMLQLMGSQGLDGIESRRSLERALKRDERLAYAAIQRCRVSPFRFETILLAPQKSAQRLARVIGRPDAWEAMSNVVIPRHHSCQPVKEG